VSAAAWGAGGEPAVAAFSGCAAGTSAARVMLQLSTQAAPIAANSSPWIRTARIDLRITLPPLHAMPGI